MPLQDRLAAIRNHPLPKNVAQLQTYLGMVNFYRRFFPAAAAVLKPLTDATRGGQKSDLVWKDDMRAAFDASKQALCAATELAHPLPGAQISLAVDASSTHVGAVLQQHEPGIFLCEVGYSSVKIFRF
jgi:hypothetical protein